MLFFALSKSNLLESNVNLHVHGLFYNDAEKDLL